MDANVAIGVLDVGDSYAKLRSGSSSIGMVLEQAALTADVQRARVDVTRCSTPTRSNRARAVCGVAPARFTASDARPGCVRTSHPYFSSVTWYRTSPLARDLHVERRVEAAS